MGSGGKTFVAISRSSPLVQGGGYAMDLNFALLVLPTLKSLQTTMRWKIVTDDDPVVNMYIVV